MVVRLLAFGPTRRARSQPVDGSHCESAAGAGRPRSPWSRRLGWLGSTWILGLLLALTTWDVVFTPVLAGLDPSWTAGLYMAAHRGLPFGTQVIFTYGPLGFLEQPWLWYGDLAVLAFLYQAALHVGLSVSLVWALRRTLPLAVTLLVSYCALVTGSYPDTTLPLTMIWCLAALAPESSPLASRIVLYGGSLFGASETLIYPRSGLVILVGCAITVAVSERWRTRLPQFLMMSSAALLVLWLAAGQSLAPLVDYFSNSFQVISGYSDAMGVQAAPVIYRVLALVVGVALVVLSIYIPRGPRFRVAAGLVMALTIFSLFKEANVRADFGHTAVFFSTAALLSAVIAYGRRRLATLVLIAALVALNLDIDSEGNTPPTVSPTAYLRHALDNVELLLDPGRRALDTAFFDVEMQHFYNLPAGMRQALRGHSVQVDPWELAAAWAYGLDWSPGPVLQDYSAYTARLDGLQAHALSTSSAPERVLRNNPAVASAAASPAGTSIDGRLIAWDPPGKYLALLCHYVPAATSSAWQVLARVPDRCGASRLIASLNTRFGATVPLPVAGPRQLVYARLIGVAVSGTERLRSLLFRARFRYVTINRARTYRLVPDTAGDGLIMSAGAGVDYPAPFTLAPEARTIRVTGRTGSLRVDVYAMSAQARQYRGP